MREDYDRALSLWHAQAHLWHAQAHPSRSGRDELPPPEAEAALRAAFAGYAKKKLFSLRADAGFAQLTLKEAI